MGAAGAGYARPMTAEITLSTITLGVRDVEASRRFYVDGLGFRSILDVPRPEDVTVLYAAALAAGATSVSAPVEREWGGVSACVADPDGFRWDFVHNPNFRIDPDGTVHLGGN